MWRLNNMLVNNQQITEEIKEEIKNTQRQMKHQHNDPKHLGHSKSSSNREVYTNKIIPQETIKITNKQPNLITKETRERRTNEVKSQQKEENNKDHRRNKTEPIEKINETNMFFFKKDKIDKLLATFTKKK